MWLSAKLEIFISGINHKSSEKLQCCTIRPPSVDRNSLTQIPMRNRKSPEMSLLLSPGVKKSAIAHK